MPILFKSAKKNRNILVHKIIFADDTAFIAHNYQDTLKVIEIFKAFGLKINLKKIEIV